jgi:NAD(P)-dependent dehydrogenase (short-subunit alcohol dehydrogenase family)
MGRLQDKVAIITGAAAGIGAGVALAFAREGANLVGADINLEKLQETAKSIQASFGTKFIPKKCDVTAKDDCQNVAAEAIKEFGRIDILVNNAGLFPVKRFLAITPEEWDRVFAINLRGYMLMCQAVLPYMVEQKKGKILMTNSSQARLSLFHQIHYACSKAGILALTRCLAAEFGPKGIFVNGYGCGYTPGTEGATKAAVDGIVAKHGSDVSEELKTQLLSKADEASIASQAIKRVGRVEDYQGIAVYLASDESNFITGQTICVDGGAVFP